MCSKLKKRSASVPKVFYMLKIGWVIYELSLAMPLGIEVSTSGARDVAVKPT